jgi:hypothetical protein
MRKTLTLALTFAVSVLLVSTSFAQLGGPSSEIDYVGFGWEDGGIPVSDPGDILYVLAIATQLDPIFGVDLGTEEVTIYIYDLISAGEFDIGGGNVMIGYMGGQIEVYRDPLMDHDWGTFPPNGQQYTFTNGTLMLSGDFSTFNLALTPQGAGSYEGLIDGVGGTIANTCDDCQFTFGGAFTPGTGAQIPDGFHLQVDGILEVLDSVGTDESSWGSVKSLFGNN